MSAISPNLVGPILQTPLAARQVSIEQENATAQRAAGDRKQTGAISEADSTIETTDNDTQVFTDAEGAGSQGRAFSDPPEDEGDTAPASDLSIDPDDGHIDIEA